jgi:hypothetical protein
MLRFWRVILYNLVYHKTKLLVPVPIKYHENLMVNFKIILKT